MASVKPEAPIGRLDLGHRLPGPGDAPGEHLVGQGLLGEVGLRPQGGHVAADDVLDAGRRRRSWRQCSGCKKFERGSLGQPRQRWIYRGVFHRWWIARGKSLNNSPTKGPTRPYFIYPAGPEPNPGRRPRSSATASLAPVGPDRGPGRADSGARTRGRSSEQARRSRSSPASAASRCRCTVCTSGPGFRATRSKPVAAGQGRRCTWQSAELGRWPGRVRSCSPDLAVQFRLQLSPPDSDYSVRSRRQGAGSNRGAENAVTIDPHHVRRRGSVVER